jgi:outer membrane protein assembly factor BamB
VTIPRRTLLSVASVAAVFSFVVLAVMLGYQARSPGENPLDSPEWRAVKAELGVRRDDPLAAGRVRDQDVELRRAFFSRRERLRIGGTLLLIGLAVALAALGLANRRSRPAPAAPGPARPAAEYDRRAGRARRALAATGSLLLAGSAALWIAGSPALRRPAETEATGGAAAAVVPPTFEDLARQWPSFRGPSGSGVAREADAPRSWNGATGENIAWKTPIPLPGANSPVVWGDRLFLTGADAEREEVCCLDAATGAMLWRKALVAAGRRAEPPQILEDTGYAAPTAATDGRFVFALFPTGRIAAFDFAGRQVWLRSFGPLSNTYGHSSSLAVVPDRVILQIDQGSAGEAIARVMALDAATGNTVWETPRSVDSSWASPIVAMTPAGPRILLSATPLAAAYDPATGAEIWRADVMSGEVAPSPVHRDGTAFFAQEGAGLFAIGTDGRGDVTKTHVRWSVPDDAPDVTSPLCDGDRVYMLTTGGTLTVLRAATGEILFTHEFEASFYASPALSGDALYLTDQSGETTVVRTGDTFEEIGRNSLGEGVYASFAFGPGRIYLRGATHLFAIGGR